MGALDEHADKVMAHSEAAGDTTITKKQEAENFLRNILAGEPIKATDVEAEAKALGITKSTLTRAKLGANVADNRWGFGKNSLVWWRRRDVALPNDWDERKAAWLAKNSGKD